MKTVLTVTKDTLRETLVDSFKHLDKYDKHSDLFGRQIINLVSIITKRFITSCEKTGQSISEFEFQTLKSDATIEIIEAANRLYKDQSRLEKIENLYNYFYRGAILRIFESLANDRKRVAIMREFTEYINNEHKYLINESYEL